MNKQHALGDLGAKILSLSHVLASEEKLTRFYIAVLTAGVASTLPIAFMNEPLAASRRPSARLSRLKLVSSILTFELRKLRRLRASPIADHSASVWICSSHGS